MSRKHPLARLVISITSSSRPVQLLNGSVREQTSSSLEVKLRAEPRLVAEVIEHLSGGCKQTDREYKAKDYSRGLVETLYALCKLGRRRQAIAQALDYFDDLLIARRFRECDDALSQLCPERIAPSVVISILGITFHAKKKLLAREQFYQKALQEITRVEGKKSANELLRQYH